MKVLGARHRMMASARFAAAVAILLSACGGADTTAVGMAGPDPRAQVANAATDPLSGCPRLVAPRIPEPFRGITLPRGAVPVEVPSHLPGEERLDLSVPGSTVGEAMQFFLDTLPKDGHTVTFTDYEGFESEIFFLYEGEDRPGSVWILVGCRKGESTVSVRLSHGLKTGGSAPTT